MDKSCCPNCGRPREGGESFCAYCGMNFRSCEEIDRRYDALSHTADSMGLTEIEKVRPAPLVTEEGTDAKGRRLVIKYADKPSALFDEFNRNENYFIHYGFNDEKKLCLGEVTGMKSVRRCDLMTSDEKAAVLAFALDFLTYCAARGKSGGGALEGIVAGRGLVRTTAFELVTGRPAGETALREDIAALAVLVEKLAYVGGKPDTALDFETMLKMLVIMNKAGGRYVNLVFDSLDEIGRYLAEHEPSLLCGVKGARDFDAVWGTTKGLRKSNEDAAAVEVVDLGDRQGIVFALSDGVGGMSRGSEASALVVKSLMKNLTRTLQGAAAGLKKDKYADFILRRELSDALLEADRTLTEWAAREGIETGATAVAGIIDGGAVHAVYSGDSRMGHFSGGETTWVSHDHSTVQRLVDAGKITEEQSLTHPRKNEITMALGNFDKFGGDFYEAELKAGDTLLIATDGICGVYLNRELAAASSGRAEAVYKSVMLGALSRGSTDNCTLIVIKKNQY